METRKRPHLGAVCEGGEGRERALLDGLGASLELVDQGGDERVQVLGDKVAVAVVREVDDGGRGVALDTGARRVLHGAHQRREDAAVLLLLDVRAQVRAHLQSSQHSQDKNDGRAPQQRSFGKSSLASPRHDF